jgi:hypothetical protein
MTTSLSSGIQIVIGGLGLNQSPDFQALAEFLTAHGTKDINAWPGTGDMRLEIPTIYIRTTAGDG